MKKTGIIYKATCSINKKVYIGQTINTVDMRKSAHISNAFNPNSHNYNTKFKRAIRKYGVSNFIWEVLYNNIHFDQLNNMEKWVISQYDSYNFGYNGTEGGDSIPPNLIRYGIKFSTEHKIKISLALKGKEKTKEHKDKLSKSHIGMKYSDEAKRNMSKSKIGLPSPMKGKKQSEKFRKMLSKRKGENHPLFGIGHTKESKAKMSKTHSSGIDRGENNGNSKLTWEKVKEIRRKYATGKYTQLKLSKEYNVTRGNIGSIIRNERWKI